MGRKQSRKRKHFLFYLTSVLIIIIFNISVLLGCAYKANLTLKQTENLMISGEYHLAMERFCQLLKEYPQMGDSILFNMGLMYANPENPDKDYKKSLIYFKRVIDEFPGSNLKNRAQLWESLLHRVILQGRNIEKQQTELTTLIEKTNFLKKEIQLKDKKLDELQKDNQLKDKKTYELQLQIEQLKEIDLNIQKKKRINNLK